MLESLSSKSTLDLSASLSTVVRDGAVVRWVCCECAGAQGALRHRADGWRRFWVSLGAGPARMRSERTTTGLTSRTNSEETLDDKDWMGLDVVICAAAGTDDLGHHARKHWCNMQYEEREREKKVRSAGCPAQTGQGVTYTEALKFLSAVAGMSKFGRESQVAGREMDVDRQTPQSLSESAPCLEGRIRRCFEHFWGAPAGFGQSIWSAHSGT